MKDRVVSLFHKRGGVLTLAGTMPDDVRQRTLLHLEALGWAPPPVERKAAGRPDNRAGRIVSRSRSARP